MVSLGWPLDAFFTYSVARSVVSFFPQLVRARCVFHSSHPARGGQASRLAHGALGGFLLLAQRGGGIGATGRGARARFRRWSGSRPSARRRQRQWPNNRRPHRASANRRVASRWAPPSGSQQAASFAHAAFRLISARSKSLRSPSPLLPSTLGPVARSAKPAGLPPPPCYQRGAACGSSGSAQVIGSPQFLFATPPSLAPIRAPARRAILGTLACCLAPPDSSPSRALAQLRSRRSSRRQPRFQALRVDPVRRRNFPVVSSARIRAEWPRPAS